MKHLISIFSLIMLTACSTSTNEVDNPNSNSFLTQNNHAHNFEAFQNAGVLSADIILNFGGKERLNGRILFDTKTQETALIHKDGRALYYENDTVWMTPDTANYPRARFDIFTWSYFLTLPHKLNDQGTHFSKYSDSLLNGTAYHTQKLTFGNNIGDAPDDWYVLYQDKTTGLLHAAAYIVTLNKEKEESEKDPHAIVYEDYQSVNGIPLPLTWKFYAWRKEKGLTQELGEAHLSNIKFINRDDQNFQLPQNKVEVKL